MSPRSIILIENDLNLRQSIVLILQRAGYFVSATDCMSKAKKMLQSGGFHLIIVDLNVPEIRASLLPDLLRKYAYLSVVALTDQPVLEIEKEDKLLNAHYLVKPVAPEALLDLIGMSLDQKSNNQPDNSDYFPIDRY